MRVIAGSTAAFVIIALGGTLSWSIYRVNEANSKVETETNKAVAAEDRTTSAGKNANVAQQNAENANRNANLAVDRARNAKLALLLNGDDMRYTPGLNCAQAG